MVSYCHIPSKEWFILTGTFWAAGSFSASLCRNNPKTKNGNYPFLYCFVTSGIEITGAESNLNVCLWAKTFLALKVTYSSKHSRDKTHTEQARLISLQAASIKNVENISATLRWDRKRRGNMRQRGKPHCSSASVKRVSAKSCLQGSFPPPSPITPSSQRQASFREMHERLEWLLSQPVSDTAELKKLHLHHRADSNTLQRNTADEKLYQQLCVQFNEMCFMLTG